MSNWSDDDLPSTGTLSLALARSIVARDHGFTSWSAVEGANDAVFEGADDAVVLGRVSQLALLTAGADRSAELHPYGGSFDVLAMLRTSAHPQAAGVSAEIERALATT